MALVSKIHHVAMRANAGEDFDRVIDFYTNVLGLSVKRSWAGGAMIEVGESVLEIFKGGEIIPQKGTLQHIALATDDIEACIKAVTDAGYEIFSGPRDVVIASQPPFPIRCAFCRGPLGEEIEFFKEL